MRWEQQFPAEIINIESQCSTLNTHLPINPAERSRKQAKLFHKQGLKPGHVNVLTRTKYPPTHLFVNHDQITNIVNVCAKDKDQAFE